MSKITPRQVARALSQQFDLPFIELPQIPASVSALVPVDFQSEHRVVPFRLEVDGKVERLHVAVADPSNLAAVDELRFRLGKAIHVFVAASDDIDEVLAALRADTLDDLNPLEIDEEPPEEPVVARTADVIRPDWFDSEPDEIPIDLDGPPDEPPPLPAHPRPAQVVKFERPPRTIPGASTVASPPSNVIALAPAAARAEESVSPVRPIEFSDEDLAVLENLEKMACGEEATLESAKVKPAQMVASLIRLLMKKGVIAEAEFLEELGRK